MIINFNKKSNNLIENNIKNSSLTQELVQNCMPKLEDIHCKCPKCKAKANYSYHASYQRNISFITENKTYDFNVKVTRVKCNSCESTHALLPSFIIPYKTFSIYSYLLIISEQAKTTVLKTAEKLSISIQLIYQIIAIFIGFFNDVDLLNREEKRYKKFNKHFYQLQCIEICNTEFQETYFKYYKWIYLMTKFQNDPSPPVYININ